MADESERKGLMHDIWNRQELGEDFKAAAVAQ